MDGLWPWLTLAGLGALHGLSPANGWMFAAARGVQARDAAQARRALLPIAIGHGASVAIVVAALTQGYAMDPGRVQRLAGALLVAAAVHRWWRGDRPRTGLALRVGSGSFGIALWAGLMAAVHGAGMLLVPALIPLCMAATPVREIAASGSIVLALLGVGVHLAAMLLTTGAIAAGVCRGVNAQTRVGAAALRSGWTAALAITGALLMAL